VGAATVARGVDGQRDPAGIATVEKLVIEAGA